MKKRNNWKPTDWTLMTCDVCHKGYTRKVYLNRCILCGWDRRDEIYVWGLDEEIFAIKGGWDYGKDI